MTILENSQIKALQLLNLVECVEDAIDDAAAEYGAAPAVNKAMNLLAILSEQLSDLADLIEAGRIKEIQ